MKGLRRNLLLAVFRLLILHVVNEYACTVFSFCFSTGMITLSLLTARLCTCIWRSAVLDLHLDICFSRGIHHIHLVPSDIIVIVSPMLQTEAA
jgi:hypothetical protein